MAVTINDATAGVQTGGTSLTVTGCSVTANDLVMLLAFHKNNATLPPDPGTGLGNFTKLADFSTTSAGYLAIWVCRAESTGTFADAVWSGTLISSSAGQMVSFSGVDTSGGVNGSALWATAFLNDSGGSDYKSQQNEEATYGVPYASGSTWTMVSGAKALAIMGVENDASPGGFYVFRDTSGTALDSGFGIGAGSTTTGTDCSLMWGHSGTSYTSTFAGWDNSITEGSAGTARNVCVMLVLNPANTAPVSAPPRRALRGEPFMGLIPRPRIRRAGQ